MIVKFLKFQINRLALIIKKYAQKAGLDSSRYSGHSLRSGFATTAAIWSRGKRNIMAMTVIKLHKWLEDIFKEANLFKNNALNKIKI